MTRLLNLFSRTGPDPMQEVYGDVVKVPPIFSASPGPVAAGPEGFVNVESITDLRLHAPSKTHGETKCRSRKPTEQFFGCLT